MRVLFIPGGVILSTYFGGGFASGRETVEFISTSGPMGGLAAIAIAAIMLGTAYFLCSEIARGFGVYDYASFTKVLLRRWAVVYEIALLLGLVVVMAVAATAAGTILEDQFGVPRLMGTAALGGVSVALAISGRRAVELSMAVTAGILLVSLSAVSGSVLANSGGIPATFASAPNSATFWQEAVLYGFFGIAFLPLVIYSSRGIASRRESAAAASFVALIFALPMVLLHVSFMAEFPAVLDEDVPSVAVAERFGGAILLAGFVIVLFVLVVQTSVGVIQGLIERVNASLTSRSHGELSSHHRAAFAVLVLGSVLVMASVGLVTLVAVGYNALALVYVAVFGIPLFTVGVARVRSIRTPSTGQPEGLRTGRS